jgi:hypothetical protein
MRRRRVVLAVAVTGLLLSACASQSDSSDQGGDKITDASPSPSASASASSDTAGGGASAADPAAVNANELGMVPVMMYHQIKADPKGGYDQSPEKFKAELERMYSENYRPITAANFVSGKIDVPAGKHPVVMTFDDSSPSQAQIGADGNPTADSALGMMEQFGKDHPDWHSTATFYVNDGSFAGDTKVIPWLVQHGYEVGDHTLTHANLKQISSEQAQKEVGGEYSKIIAQVPGYQVTTMALPFGIHPAESSLAHHGTYDGVTYDLSGVMLVGSNPSPSPFSAKFDPYNIPRIRSGTSTDGQLEGKYWLDYLQKNPSSLYTSDGDPNKISFPKAKQANLSSKYSAEANAY